MIESLYIGKECYAPRHQEGESYKLISVTATLSDSRACVFYSLQNYVHEHEIELQQTGYVYC